MTGISKLKNGIRGQIADEIRTLLADGEPMTTAEIFAKVEAAEEPASISRVIYDMRKIGEVDALAPRVGQSAQRYRLVSVETDARLMAHLERELAESTPLSESERAIAAEMDAGELEDRPDDSAHGSTAGDEFTSSGRSTGPQYDPDDVRLNVRPIRPHGLIYAHVPDAMERQAVRPERQHFAARLIADLDDPEPRLLDAAQWADVVGAIADRLDSGRALPPHPDVIAALRAMEQGLMEVAA